MINEFQCLNDEKIIHFNKNGKKFILGRGYRVRELICKLK